MSDEGLREGWLANWFITERVTGLGGCCIQLTQSDMSAHGLIVVKEIAHTQAQYINVVFSNIEDISPAAPSQFKHRGTWPLVSLWIDASIPLPISSTLYSVHTKVKISSARICLQQITSQYRSKIC